MKMMKTKWKALWRERAERAFDTAAIEVVKLAKEAGTPVVVWQDGKLVELDPHSIQLKIGPAAGQGNLWS